MGNLFGRSKVKRNKPDYHQEQNATNSRKHNGPHKYPNKDSSKHSIASGHIKDELQVIKLNFVLIA